MEFTHQAKPVRVHAEVIVDIYSAGNYGDAAVEFADGSEHVLEAALMVRCKPVVGDYVVTQEDGYVYVNPKDVFERKYSPLTPEN